MGRHHDIVEGFDWEVRRRTNGRFGRRIIIPDIAPKTSQALFVQAVKKRRFVNYLPAPDIYQN